LGQDLEDSDCRPFDFVIIDKGIEKKARGLCLLAFAPPA